MQAVRLSDESESGRVAVVDVPEPDVGNGLLLHVRSVGVCGSDLHLVDQRMFSGTFGHEIAGVLDDGTPVAIDPQDHCGTCDQCCSGASHLCRTGLATFLGFAVDGGMAERVRVPAGSLVPLPRSVSLGDACLVEPLAVGVHGLRLADVQGGMRVAVVGAGSIGLLAAAAAVPVGADVAVEARYESQRAAAERLGAATSPSGEYDVVVEAAGTESALVRAVELCRPGGTILFLSLHWAPVPIPGWDTLTKELRYQWSALYGIYGDGRDLDTAAMLLARNPEIARTVITHRFPLGEAPEAFRVAADREDGAIKVVLEVA